MILMLMTNEVILTSYRVASFVSANHKSKFFRGILLANTTCDIYGFRGGNLTMKLSIRDHSKKSGASLVLTVMFAPL